VSCGVLDILKLVDILRERERERLVVRLGVLGGLRLMDIQREVVSELVRSSY
jgi:hypothetical protein